MLSTNMVLIDSSIRDIPELFRLIESNQVTTVLTFHVLEQQGLGGHRLYAPSKLCASVAADPLGIPQCVYALKRSQIYRSLGSHRHNHPGITQPKN